MAPLRNRVPERDDPEEARSAQADVLAEAEHDRALPLLGDPRRQRQREADRERRQERPRAIDLGGPDDADADRDQQQRHRDDVETRVLRGDGLLALPTQRQCDKAHGYAPCWRRPSISGSASSTRRPCDDTSARTRSTSPVSAVL